MIALWAMACASYQLVDDACQDSVRGDHHATTDGPEGVRRMNCYRTLAGLRRVRVEPNLQEAAEGHLSWMITHDVTTSVQDPDSEGFTGVTPLDRIEASDYPMDLGQYGYWYGDLEDDTIDLFELVDGWMASPYARQFVLQLDQGDVGLAVREGLVASLSTYDNPPLEHSSNPLVYPVDGQEQVPMDYPVLGARGDDGVPRDQPLGYPITVSVGSAYFVRYGGQADPYELRVSDPVLEGPSGPVPLYPLTAADTPYDLTYTVGLFPLEPLEPLSSYRFTATVSWLSDQDETSEKNLDVTWNTAAAQASGYAETQ